MANTSSPVVARGLLFQVSGTSQLVCIDATTGKKLWSNKAAGCYASLVASGGCIYALARSGTMFIIAAERTYRLIASCPLGEGSDATPAMGDGRLYIRTHSHLWCLGAR
jgi:outer membrane protein assembly factor BamB